MQKSKINKSENRTSYIASLLGGASLLAITIAGLAPALAANNLVLSSDLTNHGGYGDVGDTVNINGYNYYLYADSPQTYAGVISGSGTIFLVSGRETLASINPYTATTNIGTDATLNLSAVGSIEQSASVVDNGVFDVSAANYGATIVSLSSNGSSGQVILGNQGLTLTNASGTFGGVISGSGSLTTSGGTQTLSGVNTYTGLTLIRGTGTLALSGSGSIASSSVVSVFGVSSIFDISATTSGASITSLTSANPRGGVVNLGSKTLTITAGNNSYYGVIRGLGSLVIAGGTLNLASGANTYSGGTSIISGAGLSGDTTSLQGAIANAGRLNFVQSTNGFYAGVISGTGNVSVGGSENYAAFTNINTYTGVTSIGSGGTLFLNGAGSIASSSSIADAGTLDISTATGAVFINGLANGSTQTCGGNPRVCSAPISVGGGVSLGSNTLNLTRANNNFSGVISGAGGLTVSGGTQYFSGLNTYTGATNIAAGAALIIQGSGTIGAGSVSNAGTLTLSSIQSITSYTQTSGSLNLYASSASSFGSLLVSGDANMANAALVLNSSGGYSPADGTSFVLVNAASGNFTGATVTGGLLRLSTIAGGLGTELVATYNSSNSSTNIMSGNSYATPNIGTAVNSVFQGGTLQVTTAGAEISSAFTLDSSTTNTIDQNGNAATFSGVFSDATSGGNVVIANSGTGGSVTFTRANTYTGTTTINAGATLALSGAGSIAASSAVNGTFDISATTSGASVTSLSGSGTVVLGAPTLTLTAATDTFSGVIGGTGGLIIAAGTETLTGTNTYTGGTTVAGGTLSLGSNSAAGTGTITTTGSVIDYANDIVIANAILINSNTTQLQTLAGVSATQSGVISETGGARPLEKIGTGTLILTGANTYTGATTISAGTLQIGNGGTSGSITGNVTNNAAIAFNRSDSVTFAGIVSGTGALTQAGTGTTILTGTNTYSGGTTISAGTLQIGNGGTTGAITGNVTDNATLAFNRSDNVTFAGIVSGTGALTQSGTGTLSLTGANTYTGGTTISAGTLQIGSGSTTGSISGNVTNNANLAFNRSDSVTFAGIVSGTGALTQSGTGTTILTAANTYSGGTTVSAGTLQIGSGSTTGSISGNVTNNANLAFNRSDSVTFAGIVSGTGALTQSGTGTLTLTGANTYTGGTTVAGGTLAVTGKIGAVTVTSGTLQGTGTVGTTTIASGSTLSPGINGAPGTLTVSGNLTMASGSNYAVAVTPTAASKAIVSGSANVNGAVTASFAAGNYTVGQKFAIVESTGLVTGTFASLTHAGAALPFYLTDNLSYTSNSVYLNLVTKNLTPLLPTGSASNLTNTAKAIDAAVTTGGIPSTGMIALYGQTGATLGTSLTQAQGQVGANLATSVTQSFTPFLKTMMAQGAPDQGATSRVWGTVYGGHTGISANVTTGAASLSGSNVGLAVGGQKNAADGSGVFGGSIAIGQQNFSSGNGTGISQDLMLGVYGTKTVMDRGYISASLGYGILNVTTTRTLTVSGTDILSGKVNAQEFGGRVEGGYRFSVDDQFGLTPYLAGSLQNIVTPSYVETVQSGTSSFALSYLSQKNTFGRTEAGTHLDRSFQLDDGSTLSAQGTIGWSHQLGYSPVSTVSFQSLSGSSFLLNGIKPANDTAVLGLKLQAQKATGLSYGVRLDSQLGAGTTILQATGNLAYRW